MTSSENEANKALKEYIEAFNYYNELIDKYFPVRDVIPGKEIEAGEPLTIEALEELERAEARVAEAHKKWDRLLGLRNE